MEMTQLFRTLQGCAFLVDVSKRLNEGIVEFRDKKPSDYRRASRQHACARIGLRQCYWKIIRLGVNHACADSQFVKDNFKIFISPGGNAGVLVYARMKRVVRQAEMPFVISRMSQLFPTLPSEFIDRDGSLGATLEFGDVIQLTDRKVIVGLSERTNLAGARRLAEIITPLGFKVHSVPIQKALHIDMCANEIAERVLLVNPDCVDPAFFESLGYTVELTPPGEGEAASVVFQSNGSGPSAFKAANSPESARIIRRYGTLLVETELDELQNLDSGATCLGSWVQPVH